MSDYNQAIHSLKNRVDVIRNFHETYKNQEINEKLKSGYAVALQPQLEALADYIKVANNYDSDYLKISLKAPIVLSFGIATNIVLLCSELMQNSCKYAFDEDSADNENLIYIKVAVSKEGMLNLDYVDNGKGKSEAQQAGLGSEIIVEIVETLAASIVEYNENGYHFNLKAKLQKDEYQETQS